MLDVPVYWERVKTNNQNSVPYLLKQGCGIRRSEETLLIFCGRAIGREGFTEEVTLGES